MVRFKKILKEILFILCLTIIFTFLLQKFIIETRYIPTASMVPTIQVNQRIIVNKFIYRFGEPSRGDVIVFSPPLDNNDTEKDYIKRVVGVSGDRVEIKDGKLFINNKEQVEPYIFEEVNYNYGPVEIPEGCLFVLGDNRNKSYDSHLWNQWLKVEDVKGKAFFTYWPLNKLGLIN